MYSPLFRNLFYKLFQSLPFGANDTIANQPAQDVDVYDQWGLYNDIEEDYNTDKEEESKTQDTEIIKLFNRIKEHYFSCVKVTEHLNDKHQKCIAKLSKNNIFDKELNQELENRHLLAHETNSSIIVGINNHYSSAIQTLDTYKICGDMLTRSLHTTLVNIKNYFIRVYESLLEQEKKVKQEYNLYSLSSELKIKIYQAITQHNYIIQQLEKIEDQCILLMISSVLDQDDQTNIEGSLSCIVANKDFCTEKIKLYEQQIENRSRINHDIIRLLNSNTDSKKISSYFNCLNEIDKLIVQPKDSIFDSIDYINKKLEILQDKYLDTINKICKSPRPRGC